MKIRALALFSGGLDSTLSARIVLEHGVEVEAIHFSSVFLSGSGSQKDSNCALQRRVAEQLGIKLQILDISAAHLEMVQRPRYGYGQNLNPCIDCRILMLKAARAYMASRGLSFLVSGEVLGQRPMSQRRDTLNIIDRDAGVKGLVLRPLSAKHLAPTLAEEAGWVDRDKLFDFSGRSRKGQLALAEHYGISEYLTPSGGCLLTEAEFSAKLKSLLASGNFNLANIQLLKAGRYFCADDDTKIVVGRNEEENEYLESLAGEQDALLKVRDFPGPLTMIRADAPAAVEGQIENAARLTARYSKCRDKATVWVDCWQKGSREKKSILVAPAEEGLIKRMRI